MAEKYGLFSFNYYYYYYYYMVYRQFALTGCLSQISATTRSLEIQHFSQHMCGPKDGRKLGTVENVRDLETLDKVLGILGVGS